ncbi:MAG TPA: hypothetical protein VHI52_13485 [Verrucomicrobiae bacterium]|nr:hypothetical protein [Verrucomicrobiae bacterium]
MPWAECAQLQLPAEVPMNTDAGRGSWVFVTVRTQSGEELPFMVDTGTPVIILDKSLEPQLGDRLSEGEFSLEGVERESGEYSAPKLYLGGAPLLTGTNVFTYDLQRLMAHALHPHPILGILGMDCLRHYCLQLDFQAGKMRFLDCPSRPASALGKAYPLILRAAPGNLPSAGALSVFIHHLGLAGGKNTNACLDTGVRTDGVVEKGLVGGHYLQRFRHLLGSSRAKFRLAACVWDDQTYTRVCVDEARNGNTLGLAFLARHLVTFDFPGQVMYLKQTSISPVGSNP